MTKEELAKDYSDKVHKDWNAQLETYKAFLVGFEKAKELMLKRDFISVFEEYHTKHLGEK